MNTGTPLDLTPFGSVLQGIGQLYWLLVLAVLAWVMKKAPGWGAKLLGIAVVLLVMVGPVAWRAWSLREQQQQAKAKLGAAQAHFEMRCKSAGEKIHRVVENVDGIVLLKLRPRPAVESERDPMWPGAAYFAESDGEDYIKSFLGYESVSSDQPQRRGSIDAYPTKRPGYRFVDVIDATSGERYRYTGPLESPASGATQGKQSLRREATSASLPGYGVTFEDIVDPEDRKYWIAGTKVQVVELATKQVIAEQVSYLWDTGLGSTQGARSPWGWASTYGRKCPKSESGFLDARTRLFVDRVLLPTKGEKV